MVPLTLDPTAVVPLPEGLRGLSCGTCDRHGAAWQIAAPGGLVPVCGLCVCYRTPWGEKRSEQLLEFVTEVARIGHLMPLEQGKLVRVADADRVVAAARLFGRVKQIQRGA